MSTSKDFARKGFLVLLSAYSIASGAASNSEYIVSTIAGGVAPVTPIAARNASIGFISGITADSAGNVYLSSDLHCVFKIDSAGLLTRFAGTCRPGYSGDGGPALNAQLHHPTGLAVDGRGTLYIADSDNHVVRKVLKDGTIATIAGNGRPATSGDGGPAIKAALTNPKAVAVDAVGNLYIAELNSIRRVSPDGIITNLVGNGTAGVAADGRTAIKAQWIPASSLAVDVDGNLYFSTPISNEVRRISPSGVISAVAGTGQAGYSGDGGPGAKAQLSYPDSVALDREGHVYIADSRNSRIRRVSVDGTITTVAGNGTEGPSGDGGLAVNAAVSPFLLAVGDRGTVYVVGDTSLGTRLGRLRKLSADGRISTVTGNDSAASEDHKPAIQSPLYYPSDIMIDFAGNIVLAEGEKRRIRRIDTRGRITTVAGCPTCSVLGDSGPATRARIGSYLHIAGDAKGNLYISDLDFHRVRKVSPKGIITTVAGTGSPGFAGDDGPAAMAQLNAPAGIAVDSSGNIYIADGGNGRVRRIAVNGTIDTVAGNGSQGHFADGRAAVDVPLSPRELAVDSRGNLYILEPRFPQLRKVSPTGIISTINIAEFTQSIALDDSDTLYLGSGSTFSSRSLIVRRSAEGSLDPIAGTGPGYSGDGGPALQARFSGAGGIAVDRMGRIYASDSGNNAVRMLTPIPAPTPDTSDLKIELRSATGSNRFQIGAEIPLEAVLSSSTPNRYLQPCSLFNESHFGFPQCRFFNRWTFSIESGAGWVDLTQEFPSGPVDVGGPSFEMPHADLSTKPVTVPYVLTHRFRFDVPGEYRVRLAMDVGFDDETTQRKPIPDPTIRPHKVSVTRDLVLQIVLAGPAWQDEIIRKGVEAMSWLVQPRGQPSQELLQRNQEAANALCNLGTSDAARALAGLLLRKAPNHQQEEGCLEHTADPKAAIEEMERLLVDPDAAINSDFFRALIMLLGLEESRASGVRLLVQAHVDNEREKLFAALPQKRGDAQISSLLTVLAYPARAKGNADEFGANVPFAQPVITTTVANFDRLPAESQEWLVDDGWDRLRSPLMLPVVRRMAMDGEGHALLRWLELDAPAATAFIREEVVRPRPRFSSFYLRLPEDSLHGQEARIASNFIALNNAAELSRAATLLHRYATGAVLATVLPFIDANRATWPCSIQVPVLAYLLKVSPGDAEPRLAEALSEANQGACRTNTFFTDIGFLQPSPLLDRLALAETDKGPSPLAIDAAADLRRYGSLAVKPLLHERLVKWRGTCVNSGAEKRFKDGAPTPDDYALRGLVQTLAESFGGAQAWLLSAQESSDLQTLLGAETTGGMSCQFSCGASLGTDGAPRRYAIYGRVNEKFERRPSPMEYLNLAEHLHYTINQYRCETMSDLKRKILQFPAGSTFDFAWDFTAADRNDIVEIGTFLRSHGYRVGSTHGWPFLQPDPPGDTRADAHKR